MRISRLFLAGGLAAMLFATGVLIPGSSGSGARAAAQEAEPTGVLPCNRKIALTSIFRVDRRIRFEGVAEPGLNNKLVRIYETRSEDLVAKARIQPDGTWWGSSSTKHRRYSWLSKFVAEIGGERTRWRRLGQAVGIRGRKPARTGPDKTRIKLKVSGNSPERLVAGVQTSCSRLDVSGKFELETGPNGVAYIRLPRPAPGEPYAIYRIATEDGWRISPPIVVRPAEAG